MFISKFFNKRKSNKSIDENIDIYRWGFSYDSEGGNIVFTFSWGSKRYYYYPPWAYIHVRHEILMKDGTWQSEPRWDSKNPTREEFNALVATETHPYRYLLKRGEFQNCDATIKVSEMEWRRKWLKHIPIFRFIKRTIDVTFSAEVGERSGSWKGGTIGCSELMLPEETPRDTLKRMERTRKF